VIIGLIAGWAARKIMKGSGYGVVMDTGAGYRRRPGRRIPDRDSGYPLVVAIFGAVRLIWLSYKLKKQAKETS
jgi:uncharacterized membrane protein YeaQ/YmgE (transglycosylase-associated protein family)